MEASSDEIKTSSEENSDRGANTHPDASVLNTSPSRHQKRLTWACLALLVALILLTTIILALGLEDTGPYAGQLIFLLNVTVAISAGVIASSITGFFELFFRKRLGRYGEFSLRAAGGFAVFVLVMYMSPSNQIEKFDAKYARSLSACEAAVLDSAGDAESLCKTLAKAYPHEAQPRKLLARYWHINQNGAEDLLRARNGYREALELLNINIDTLSRTSSAFGDEQGQAADWGEILRRAISSSADHALAVWQEGGTTEQARRSLDALLGPLAFLDRHYTPQAGVIAEASTRTIDARVRFYLAILDPKSVETHLSASLDRFRHTMNDGRQYFHRELEALVVLGALEQFQTDHDHAAIKREIADALPELWNAQTAHRNGAQSTDAFEKIVAAYRLGDRNEHYRVTQLIGSSAYFADDFEAVLAGCDALTHFFDRNFPVSRS